MSRPRLYYGFDYLRAVMCLFVVAWHTFLFGRPGILDPTVLQTHRVSIPDIINFNLLLLAVPVFYLVSLFLSSVKVTDKVKLFKRLDGFVYLYVFWMALWIVEIGYGSLTRDVNHAVYVLASGGGSPVYYILYLIPLTCVCLVAVRLRPYFLWVFLVASLALIWFLPFAVATWGLFPQLIVYWNPMSFLPYAFISALAAHYVGENSYSKKGTIVGLLSLSLCFVGLAVWEWHYLPSENSFAHTAFAIPAYMRLSVVAGASCLFLGSFLVSNPAPRVVRLLSDYSLGIFCVHMFLVVAYRSIIHYQVTWWYSLGQFGFALTASIMVVFFLKRAFRRRSV